VRLGKKAVVHIALDTGMRRIGFRCNEESVTEILEIAKLPGIEIEGLFTHFAEADLANKEPARKQLAEFIRMDERLREQGLAIPIRHVSNSAAIMELPEARFEMVRAGIILYGLSPSEEMDTQKFPLSPVMELKAHVVYIKEIEDGEAVSYGGTYIAKGRRRIGTVPLWYADGYSRLLSNKGSVLIRGQRAPIAGRICMDQFMIDLTDIPEAQEGDEIILFGSEIPLDELAEMVGTISYELACQISARVPRRSCR
jgi:alanine racemase